MNSILHAATESFEELCESLCKFSYIRKMPKGYWGVYSRKGKLLGKYKSEEQAKKRLKQIDFFKHQKKASLDIETGYSGIIRELNKKYPEEIVRKFRKIYKEIFDNAIINEDKSPEETALNNSLQFIDELETDQKVKSAIDRSVQLLIKNGQDKLGNPIAVGEYLANLVKFLCRKISEKNRNKSLHSLKNKFYLLNEYEIAGKKLPPAASMGQSLTVVKHLLFGKEPAYIRQVLNAIASNL